MAAAVLVPVLALSAAQPAAASSAAGSSAAAASSAASRPHKPPAPHTTSITINGLDQGAAFQGIGAVSGGGGNSRLLIDYPKAQRQQVLDYLFKPGYGASLQILKLEIGGDTNTTDGAEPSVEHASGSIDCAAGYEFWLARQARRLNPAIKLYGLQWGAPDWVSGGSQTIWTSADVGYVIDWLNCARAQGVTINYIGGWNEHGDGTGAGGPAWFEELRTALDANGYGNVQIVTADSVINLKGQDVANDLAADPAFDASVGVLGYHDSCQYPTTGLRCLVPAAASELGKPIWESEIGHMDSQTGAAAMARSINMAYIEAGVTGLLEWPLMDSMPPYLPDEDRGLVWADRPWSGSYKVNLMTWAIAQTTQFTSPGWHYVAGGDGELGDPVWGNYVSYEAPGRSASNGRAWSMVAQTSRASASQVITVHLVGGLAHSVVHVWSTNLRSASPKAWFDRDPEARPVRGTFRYVLKPGFVYSFTTTSGQGKGQAKSPGPGKMAFPYTSRPDGSDEPWGMATQEGAFEYAKDGKTIVQTASGLPVLWALQPVPPVPYAVVGSDGWTNYTVSAQVMFTGPNQSAGLIARYQRPDTGDQSEQFYGYQFTVSADGSWQLIQDNHLQPAMTIDSGTVPPLGSGTWHTVTLTADGSQLTATIDANQVAVEPTASPADPGLAGISTGGWYPVDFRDLTVGPAQTAQPSGLASVRPLEEAPGWRRSR
jgi:Glycosyl hydrolase family 59/Concanavalin A-like lectin/glucanases superfamily